jgi:hypothetical protein
MTQKKTRTKAAAVGFVQTDPPLNPDGAKIYVKKGPKKIPKGAKAFTHTGKWEKVGSGGKPLPPKVSPGLIWKIPLVDLLQPIRGWAHENRVNQEDALLAAINLRAVALSGRMVDHLASQIRVCPDVAYPLGTRGMSPDCRLDVRLGTFLRESMLKEDRTRGEYEEKVRTLREKYQSGVRWDLLRLLVTEFRDEPVEKALG